METIRNRDSSVPLRDRLSEEKKGELDRLLDEIREGHTPCMFGPEPTDEELEPPSVIASQNPEWQNRMWMEVEMRSALLWERRHEGKKPEETLSLTDDGVHNPHIPAIASLL